MKRQVWARISEELDKRDNSLRSLYGDGWTVESLSQLDLQVVTAVSQLGTGATLVSGVWLAAGSLRQRRGSAVLQWDCAGDGTEWEKEVGAFSLGLSEVFAAELSRVGGSFHRPLAVGAELLSTTAEAGQGTPRGGTRVGLQMDSRCFPLLERWGRL